MKYDITFHPGWWYKNAGIEFIEDFFADPEYRIKCDIKMRKTLYEHFGQYGIGEAHPSARPILGSNLIAAGYLYSALAGCSIVYSADNSPQVKCSEISDEDISSYSFNDYQKHPLYTNLCFQMDWLREKYGYVIPAVNLMGIQNIALDLMGQNLFIAYYTEPEAIDKLLSSICDMTVDLGKKFINLNSFVSSGVTAIVEKTVKDAYVTSNCSVEMISNDLYEQYLLKYDNKLAETFKCFGIHHCGQTMEHVVEGYSKVKNLKFAEVGAGSDVEKVRQALPNCFLNVRYSPVTLKELSEDDIFNSTRELINRAGDKASISCVGIDKDVEDNKIIAFLSACQESNV